MTRWLGLLALALLASRAPATEWQHPAGIITARTIDQVRARITRYDWASDVWARQKRKHQRWVDVSLDALRNVFPTTRGNVYHNYSDPVHLVRLKFDPFNASHFTSPVDGQQYSPSVNAGIYPSDHPYCGTLYDGWINLFYSQAGSVAVDLAVIGTIEDSDPYIERAVDLLMLFEKTINNLPTDHPNESSFFNRVLTYHREGDNKILNNLAIAYELVRNRLTADQCRLIEKNVLERMLNDVVLDPIYETDWNNVYQWHRTVLQTAVALEREDLLDWSFGYGDFDMAHQPEHRSIQTIVANHFLDDGAFWELCSGYHLYPVNHFCHIAMLSRNLSRMDPKRFPARRYDLTDLTNPGAEVLRNALHWFLSMAMPDRSMPIIGDSGRCRSSMLDYIMTAELGYRYYDIKAVGDYKRLRGNGRRWEGLLFGAPEIQQHTLPYTSAYLAASGWVALRSKHKDNALWIGLNALKPGGGHQHADRLSLTSFSQDTLLALEKGVPYNDPKIKRLGSESPLHNTVTVDRASQKRGHTLTDDEVPIVRVFFGGPVVQYAELHGDNIYPQTRMYRRSVALIEDIAVDLFTVVGGQTHYWNLLHAGGPPTFSMPMAPATFTPAEWLANGTDKILCGDGRLAWQARWQLGEVTSRLTMGGANDTVVYGLETFPIDNSRITPEHPPCQTVCVRRTNDEPFFAVWDAWRDEPNLRRFVPGRKAASAVIETSANTYYVMFGPGKAAFDGGVSLDSNAAFSLWRSCDAAVMIGGSRLTVATPAGQLQIGLRANRSAALVPSNRASVTAELVGGKPRLTIAADIHYATWGGTDHPRAVPDNVSPYAEGDLWKKR